MKKLHLFMFSGLCFSKIGMITCCKRCRKPNGNDAENADASETVPTDETLQVAVLLNESERAATLWHQSENPMSKIVTLNNILADTKMTIF